MTFSDETLFSNAVLTLFFLIPPTYIPLRFIQAPYGKHYRPGAGPATSPAIAWFLMESPTIWFTLFIFSSGQNRTNPKALTLISIFLCHYINRTFIYPLRLLNTNSILKPFPIYMTVLGFIFNMLNAYLQSRWVSHYADYDGCSWWFWVRFGVGLLLFVTGMVVNIRSDLVLMRLKGKDGGYKIPRGGWFDCVSCPNYFGEILEWLGWTVMTWSWAGFAFFLYTCSNLVPRARANHIWYMEKFKEEYPKSRRAVVPFVY